MALRDREFESVDDGEVDYDFEHPSRFFGTHVNLIPLQSAVAGPRLFYGARFYNQALPLKNAEAPLVQARADKKLNGEDASFDDVLGSYAGAVRANDGGSVLEVTPDSIKVQDAAGKVRDIELYNQFPFNRKSVTGDTRVAILRHNGLVWCGQISEYTAQAGDQIWSIDPGTFQGAWKKVNGFTKHLNDRRLLRVHYASGRHVDVTEDHSLITLSDAGALTPVMPEQSVPGVTRSPLVLWPGAISYKWRRNGWYDWGTLAGLYLAEGHLVCDRQWNVQLAVKPKARQREILKLCRRLGLPAAKYSGCVVISCFPTVMWLREWFGELAHLKTIGAQVWLTPSKFKAGLLNGYMAGDGTVYGDSNGSAQVTAVSVSRELRDGLVDVCSSLGLLTTVFNAPRKHKNLEWRDGHGFRIATGSLKALPSIFFYSDKQMALRKITRRKTRASELDVVPVFDRKALYDAGKVDHEIRKAASRGYVSKHRLSRHTGVYGKLGAATTTWPVIESIEPIPHQDWVYDFSVEDSEAFAVNGGLIVHNTQIHNTALVKPGDTVTAGQVLAKSNYTDDKGTLALGLNARVGLVPYLGRSMDDAIVISDSFAKRLTSNHLYSHDLDYKRGVKPGKAHFMGMFPQKFTRDQLGTLDDDGVVSPGQILKEGDPIILATKPRVISSTSAQLGLLSKHMKNVRQDSSLVWDKTTPGRVADVQKLRNGVRVNIETDMPAKDGDKIVFRSGQKGVISHVIPDEQMPRTTDGNPLEVLLNPLGVPSRVNNSIVYELLMGKVAQKLGKPFKVDSFNQPHEKWYEMVRKHLDDAGLNDTEEVFDPALNRKLENPITVGVGHVLKLHHTSESKVSARGQGAYTSDQQPLHGGSEAGKSKRLSGLETHSLLSSGAYGVLREGATLRGQRNDDYWRMLRQGYEPKEPGKPFVWDKFKALLSGAGYQTKDMGKGRLRLQFWTDGDLDRVKPMEVKTGDLVNINDMSPVDGGLFDNALTGSNSWGFIKLPHPVPNPAAEDVIRKLLGLTEKQFRAVMAGDMELPEHLLKKQS